MNSLKHIPELIRIHRLIVTLELNECWYMAKVMRAHLIELLRTRGEL